MTALSNGLYEDDAKNLVDINGKVLVLAEKRTRCEVYSRVVGYLRPVQQWNKGKKAEWADRVDFQVKIEGAEPIEEHDA